MTMAGVIYWSEAARADLETLVTLIARDSPIYARHVTARIIETVERLACYWELGRGVPEATDRDDLREVLLLPYRIIYRANSDGFTVVTVIHGPGDARRHPTPPPDLDWSSGGHRR